jgi:hypothetical protein
VTTVLISTPSTREALDIVDTLHDSDYSEGELDAAKGQLMCFLASVTDESEEYYSEFSLAQLKRLTEKTDAVREFLYSKDSEEDPRWVESEGLDELE